MLQVFGLVGEHVTSLPLRRAVPFNNTAVPRNYALPPPLIARCKRIHNTRPQPPQGQANEAASLQQSNETSCLPTHSLIQQPAHNKHTILALRLEMNRRVAWYTAWGLQCSGSVRKRISSQFCRLGMTLKALGTLPAVKRLMILPTAWYTSTTFGSRPGGTTAAPFWLQHIVLTSLYVVKAVRWPGSVSCCWAAV